MKHKGCEGTFLQYRIPEHHYCFMRCDICLKYLSFFSDGEEVRAEVRRLMLIKVRPHIERC